MGHRDSSETLSGSGAFRAAASGTSAPASQHRAKNVSVTARALLTAIRVYQMFFSALMPSACKFYPSCSRYAAVAVELHGARHGSWLALKRLARCHPFTRGGVDFVPEPEEYSCGANPSAPAPDFGNAGDAGASYTSNSQKSEVHS
jgi:putative membrane protein insertion efficiency factor